MRYSWPQPRFDLGTWSPPIVPIEGDRAIRRLLTHEEQHQEHSNQAVADAVRAAEKPEEGTDLEHPTATGNINTGVVVYSFDLFKPIEKICSLLRHALFIGPHLNRAITPEISNPGSRKEHWDEHCG
jgi:hypothetical protein